MELVVLRLGGFSAVGLGVGRAGRGVVCLGWPIWLCAPVGSRHRHAQNGCDCARACLVAGEDKETCLGKNQEIRNFKSKSDEKMLWGTFDLRKRTTIAVVVSPSCADP